jgi:endonuclease/exonuclease/phosphatase family metal-dependent hydrolase
MLNQVETFLRKLRRGVSRSEWLIRLLHLTKTQGAASEPGLILIQIDGLSRRQMERAMAKGRMPFLAQLLRKHKYRLHSLYSGLPSSTPAMTAELLYGVKCAVPAFSFYDRSREKIVRMFEPKAAKDMDERLQGQGPPLLAGGSAYAAIYTGGAAETHFCASVMGLDDLFRARYPARLSILLLFSIFSLVRVGVLLVIEFFLALFDVVRGLIAGQDLWREIKFIPSRVGVSILMRELAAIGAMIDATRGLPVIYLDFVGYDEQSHRRGPTSRFAHWSLKGIDKAIERIWKAARRSAQRDYDVWVFSDHGSEEAMPYPVKHGRSLREAVAEVFGGAGESVVADHDTTGIQAKRMRSYMLHKSSKEPGAARGGPSDGAEAERKEPIVVAMGPVGHIYVDPPLDDPQRQRLAQALVERAQIPMVAVPEGHDKARVWMKSGRFLLPEDASQVFSGRRPFLEEMTQDFIALCRHPNAGDFVIWGWSRDEPYVTFPIENGSHAGPGLEETHAFALLPEDAPHHVQAKGYLRPLDLRDAALRHLGRYTGQSILFPPAAGRDGMLRVMTYNVHSCVGIDGKLSPRRVARVISRYAPDVVALQEVDVGRLRTGQADQAQIIAEYLRMEYHFNPTIQIEEEAYGDCVLSRMPMRLIKTGRLPSLRDGDAREPRGAIWVAIELDGHVVHLTNTHLGLNAQERLLQVRTLLGPEWLGGLDPSHPIVLCGDFNASPRSHAWRLCSTGFRDVQMELSGHYPGCTWSSHYPLVRIDHIFVNQRVRVAEVCVGDDYLARVASDHRPLIAGLTL